MEDTAGSDRLNGTIGSDIFELGRDGQFDKVYEFKDGEDKIDLTAFSVGFDTCYIVQLQPNLFMLQVRDEKTWIRFADQEPGEAPISFSSLDSTDFIFKSGIPAAPPQVQSDSDGSQKMYGSTMPDVFIFNPDADRDYIKRFEDDKDLIDLSSYSIQYEDLEFIDVGPGRVRIKVHHENGKDVLVVVDRSELLDAVDLTEDDFIFG